MADPRFAPLLQQGLLLCPRCANGGSLVDEGHQLRCGACDQVVPIVSGVPDFFSGYATSTTDVPVDHGVVAEIRRILDLPDTEDVASTIATALREAARDTDSPALTAEIREVHARFVGGDIDEPPIPTRANERPKASIERHYSPAGFVAGERRFVNVRFTNRGDHSWSSRTHPTNITAGARFSRRSLGRTKTSSATYTPLPIDVEPGRSITVPIEVSVPDRPGRYLLDLGLVEHPSGFIDDAGVRLEVEVHANDTHPSTRPLPRTVAKREGVADYGEDHRIANEMVDAALDRWWPNDDRLLVEIGGSTHPQSWNHARSTLINIDISAPTLQLGALYDRHHDRSIVHLCADAMASPLAPASWHAVTMYATLHHFPEPERLLAAAAALLVPGGIVAVMCEPTGTTLAHPAGVRDLLGGINEQTFAVDEYLWMADRAGLEVAEAFDDGGSFKAILRHKPAARVD